MKRLREFTWTPAMGEISGFGGSYERCCRAMVKAGCRWFTEHPTATPTFATIKGVYGVIDAGNADAKALEAVVVKAAEKRGGATGAMVQATISATLFIHARGWPAYVAALSKRRRKS